MIDFVINKIILIFLILFPVFYLPVTSESHEYNKMALLIVSVSLLLFLSILQIAQKRHITRIKSSFGTPLVLLAGVASISVLFQSPNLVLALTTPLSVSTIIACSCFYFLIVHSDLGDTIGRIMQILVFESVIIAIYIIFVFTGLLPNSSLTPIGTFASTLSFLSAILIFLISSILTRLMDKKLNWRYKISSLFPNVIAFIFIFGTSIFLLVQLVSDKKPIILPFSFGWLIFLETLKNLRTLLLGVGPANFITAFTLTKPFAFNATPQWNVIFTQSSSFLLNLITETGSISGILYLFIILKSLKLLKQSTADNKPATITLLFVLILQIFLPSSMALFILTIILLYLSAEKNKISQLHFEKLGAFSYLPAVPAVLVCGLILYFSAKFYLAEVYFKKSLDHFLNSEGSAVYQNQDAAITLNPYLDRYHVAFSQTNLILADNIASKKNLTGSDKQNIPNLVKQAIDHARMAVILNRTNELNWDNLARIYSGLIGYAQGAEVWSAYSFQQKLALDSLNPNTYIALSSLNLSLNKFSEAENMARRAVTVKPDLANAYYYLNLALQGQKKYKEAFEELKKTYALLKPDSADGQKISGELEQLSKLVPKDEASTPAKNSPAPDQAQNQQLNQATSSAIQSLPDSLPTISLPQPPQ